MRRGDVVESGILTGFAAGLYGGFLFSVAYEAMGFGFWLPAKLVAACVFGVHAILGGPIVVIAGIFIHFVASAILGVCYAQLTAGESSIWDVLIEGPLFGVAVWALATFVVLPYVDPILSERLKLTPMWWFAAHMTYGLGLSQNVKVLRGLRIQGPSLTA